MTPRRRSSHRWRWWFSKSACGPDAIETVAFLKEQGIALKVLSGDSPVTVAAVSARAGIDAGDGAIAGADLPEDPAQLAEVVAAGSVFGRLTPEHKRAMVEALTARGAYVAMIGDGVNDVPAMKASRLAISLGSGSQLAKSVADGVLVSDVFSAIPRAIGEGRQIIRNVQRVAKLFVTKSVFAAFVIITFGLTTAGFPLLPRHLSLAGVFTVGIPGFALALSRDSAPPDSEPFLRSVARFSIPAGIVTGAATLVAYLAVAPVKGYTHPPGPYRGGARVRRGGAVRAAGARRRPHAGQQTPHRVRAGTHHRAGRGLPDVVVVEPGTEFFALSQPSVWLGIVVIAVFVGVGLAAQQAGLSPYAQTAGRRRIRLRSAAAAAEPRSLHNPLQRPQALARTGRRRGGSTPPAPPRPTGDRGTDGRR